MDTNQAKADTEWKAWRKRMADNQEQMNAILKEMMAEIKPEMEIEMMACQEMEARLEENELTSVEMKPEVAQQREVKWSKDGRSGLGARSKPKGDARSLRN
jgi:hypothetical protein